MEVSVRELKDHLSEYLRRTQAGEEINVASRGRPVGRLVPPRPHVHPSDNEALEQLRGIPGIRPGDGKRLQGGDHSPAVPAGTTEELTDWVRGG